jgi:hypothetical protein
VEGVPNIPPLGAGVDPKRPEEPGAGAGEAPNKLVPPAGAGDPNPPPNGAGAGAPKAEAGADVDPNMPPPGAGAGDPNAGGAPGVGAGAPKVCVVLAPQVIAILDFALLC